MVTIDHSHTIVLLIGASQFPNDPGISPIPNVATNISLLQQLLTDPAYIGIPAENIEVSLNEERRDIEIKLQQAIDRTRHKKFTLLVYYSGHGILSAADYKLYLTSYKTSYTTLRIDGINIDHFKNYIHDSKAGRKIVILDCCHSGAIIGAMNDRTSSLLAELKGFEGTYVMTSAAADTPSLFPVDNAQLPTYFTGKLVETVQNGLDIEQEYCTLRDIFNQIDTSSRNNNLPRPQQSNINNADELYFSKNPRYRQRKPADEQAWEAAQATHTIKGYMDLKRAFPDSPFASLAKQRIYAIEEEESWKKAIRSNTISSLDEYLEQYPAGKYATEAEKRITAILEKEPPPPRQPIPPIIEPSTEQAVPEAKEKEEYDQVINKGDQIIFNKGDQIIVYEKKEPFWKKYLAFLIGTFIGLLILWSIWNFVWSKGDNRTAIEEVQNPYDSLKRSRLAAIPLGRSLQVGDTRLYFTKKVGLRRAAAMVDVLERNQYSGSVSGSMLIDTVSMQVDEQRDTIYVNYRLFHASELSPTVQESMNRLGKLVSDSLYNYCYVKIRAFDFGTQQVYGLVEIPPYTAQSIMTQPEVPARFYKAGSSWDAFVKENIKYPDTAIQQHISGTLMVQFIVDKAGNTTNVQAVRGPELLRTAAENVIVLSSGYWIPAKHNGRLVLSMQKLPISFVGGVRPNKN